MHTRWILALLSNWRERSEGKSGTRDRDLLKDFTLVVLDDRSGGRSDGHRVGGFLPCESSPSEATTATNTSRINNPWLWRWLWDWDLGSMGEAPATIIVFILFLPPSFSHQFLHLHLLSDESLLATLATATSWQMEGSHDFPISAKSALGKSVSPIWRIWVIRKERTAWLCRVQEE